MGKMVGIAEFKAKCERLISQMELDGVPIELTRRGKVVGVLSPPTSNDDRRSPIGFLKNDRYRFDWDPEQPVCDPEDWEALR